MKKLFGLGAAFVGALAIALVALTSAGPAYAANQPFTAINGLRVGAGTKTATAVSGAATLNKLSGTITTESLTTAAGTVYTLTITDSAITATDIVQASVDNGTNTAGMPDIVTVHAAAGSLVIKVQNIAASGAFNGTLLVKFVSLKL